MKCRCREQMLPVYDEQGYVIIGHHCRPIGEVGCGAIVWTSDPSIPAGAVGAELRYEPAVPLPSADAPPPRAVVEAARALREAAVGTIARIQVDPRTCKCGCGDWFQPTSGNQRYIPEHRPHRAPAADERLRVRRRGKHEAPEFSASNQ